MRAYTEYKNEDRMTEYNGNGELCRSPEIANVPRDKELERIFEVELHSVFLKGIFV